MALSKKQQEEYNAKLKDFLLALIDGNEEVVKKQADALYSYIDSERQKTNNPEVDVSLYVNLEKGTALVLESLKFAIKSSKHSKKPQDLEKVLPYLKQVEVYANENNKLNRASILQSLIETYSKSSKEYRLGQMTNQQAKAFLDTTHANAAQAFKTYCKGLIDKLDYVELKDENQRSQYKKYLTAQHATNYGKDGGYEIDTLIQQSQDLIALELQIDNEIKKVKPQYDAVNDKSRSHARKLVDALYVLVELIASFGNKLKVILGVETKDEQRQNLIWREFKAKNPEVLQNANKSKHSLEKNMAELPIIRTRVNRGSKGEFV